MAVLLKAQPVHGLKFIKCVDKGENKDAFAGLWMLSGERKCVNHLVMTFEVSRSRASRTPVGDFGLRCRSILQLPSSKHQMRECQQWCVWLRRFNETLICQTSVFKMASFFLQDLAWWELSSGSFTNTTIGKVFDVHFLHLSIGDSAYLGKQTYCGCLWGPGGLVFWSGETSAMKSSMSETA